LLYLRSRRRTKSSANNRREGGSGIFHQ
jgi:hypothetical protein